MQEFRDQLTDFIANSPELTTQIFETVGIILVLWLLRFVTVRIIQRQVEDRKAVYKWRKNLTYITAFLGALIIGQVWFAAIGSLGTFLGLLSAGTCDRTERSGV